MRKKDAYKKKYLRNSFLSVGLSLSILAGCSSNARFTKKVFPNLSPKESVVETLKRFKMQAESVSDYYDLYEKEIENSLEEKRHNLSYAEQRMIINSLVEVDYLARNREEFNPERYKKAEDVVKDISGEALRHAFSELDFVIEIEEDIKERFYNGKDGEKINRGIREYISDITSASKIDLGASPSVRKGRVHFKTFTKLENLMGFSQVKWELGTDTLEIILVRHLDENWTTFTKYEIDEYERKESEVVFNVSRNYGGNARLAIIAGWGKPLGRNSRKTQETYIGLNFIRTF